MTSIRTILHPTDFSEQSGFAFRLACSLARDYHARLILLHTFTPAPLIYGEGFVPPDPQSIKEDLRAQLEALPAEDSGIRVERRLEEGSPAPEILCVAQEANADLIVMGTHGRTGLSRLLMGSVAERVVRRALCPV